MKALTTLVVAETNIDPKVPVPEASKLPRTVAEPVVNALTTESAVETRPDWSVVSPETTAHPLIVADPVVKALTTDNMDEISTLAAK